MAVTWEHGIWRPVYVECAKIFNNSDCTGTRHLPLLLPSFPRYRLLPRSMLAPGGA